MPIIFLQLVSQFARNVAKCNITYRLRTLYRFLSGTIGGRRTHNCERERKRKSRLPPQGLGSISVPPPNNVVCAKERWRTKRLEIEPTHSLRSKRFGKAFRTFNALFAFLAAGKLGRAQKSPVLRSPQFLRSQKAKNASNGRKALRKRLLRRLAYPGIDTSLYKLHGCIPLEGYRVFIHICLLVWATPGLG